MTKEISLFIDELGLASPKALTSPLYILCGIMVNAQTREELRIRADQIKFKYWNRTNIVFHSREIGRREGDFKILRNEEVEKNFHKDLFSLLLLGSYQLFSVIVNKSRMPKNWTEVTLYKKTSEIIIQNFIFALLAKRNCRGRLVVESATAEKDFYYHGAASHFLSNGFRTLGISYQQVQSVLTEISFVTKKNHDIEEQIADLLAYGLKLKYERHRNALKNSYETKIIETVEKKLFVLQTGTGEKKKKFYSKIESYKIIP